MQRKRVVYFLGAGFSAPLGLPLMSNFLEMSRDLCFDKTSGDFSYFSEVFAKLRDLSVIKNYAKTNLHNIEEVLSLLEMEAFATDASFKDKYLTYLRDVITLCTPEFKLAESDPHKWPGNWHDFCFGAGLWHRNYGHFACGLMNLKLVKSNLPSGELRLWAEPEPSDATYSVITTNYDMVLESLLILVNQHFRSSAAELRMCFTHSPPNPPSYPLPPFVLNYAKLHGTLRPFKIVAPTWNKAGSADMQPTWKLAFSSLHDATHVRVIGYSMPATDSYVRYLLMMGLRETQNLKRVDVICLDGDGATQRRYDEMFHEFPNYHFLSAKTEDYLKSLFQGSRLQRAPDGNGMILQPSIESGHDGFMTSGRAS